MAVSGMRRLTGYLSGAGPISGKTAAPVGPQQAHFTALDGTVRVKKAGRNTWVAAEFNLPLEKGDVVQTGAEGMAKLYFSDGTSYTVMPDSLMVIEEHSANAEQQTRVTVEVTTGTVDLATGTFTQGSTSQVVMAGARASFAPETTALVRNNPRADRHEILVKKGQGEVTRNRETVKLKDYEKVSFASDSPTMMLTKEVGPPTLISPSHMSSVYAGEGGGEVELEWTPSANSRAYRVRVSRNRYFSSTILDKRLQATSLKLGELSPGIYFWVVTSEDAVGRESAESERNQFTVAAHAAEANVALELEPLLRHGHVIEIKGKTEPNARVTVNGQEVSDVRADGGFSYFTPSLPEGENVLTVTVRSAKGGAKTMQKKVVID